MKTVFALVMMLAWAPLGQADEVDVLLGTYSLQRAVIGACYPSITVKREHFLGSPGPDFGIYGAPGQGQVVFQFGGVNKGSRTSVQENPMLGTITGYATDHSSVEAGRIQGTRVHTDLLGQVMLDMRFSGELKGEELTYSASTLSRYENPAISEASTCVYRKN